MMLETLALGLASNLTFTYGTPTGWDQSQNAVLQTQ
jgi:hypothetical protein